MGIVRKSFGLLKKHKILFVGIAFVLLDLIAGILIETMDLQYDDSGLGTILVLGDVVYAFPIWVFAEINMPIIINEYDPYFMTIFAFGLLDFFLVLRIRKWITRSKNP